MEKVNMAEPENRGHFYLITGLVIGLIIGIIIGWWVKPVSYVDISPRSLHTDYKANYLMLITQAYQSDGDMGRAVSRLELMESEPNITDLRNLQLIAEADPDLTGDVHAIRDFLNDYERAGSQPGPVTVFDEQSGNIPADGETDNIENLFSE